MPRGSKNLFFEHGHVAYQIGGDDEQNRMQVSFSCKGQTGDLWVRSKGQISSNFGYHVNFKILIPNFVCVLANERYKTNQTGFSFCQLGHAPGVGRWGCPGGQKIKHSHVAYQIDEDDEQNASKIFILGSNW